MIGKRRWTAVVLAGLWGAILGVTCVVIYRAWGLRSVSLGIGLCLGGILAAEMAYYGVAKRLNFGLVARHSPGQQGAAPNGGPTTRSGNSGVAEGPPSVS